MSGPAHPPAQRHAGASPRGLRVRMLAILVAAAALLLWAALHQLRDSARSEAQARAQLVADAVASRITRAVDLGIPLADLQGVDALFAQRMQTADVAAIALQDAAGRQLWFRARDGGTVLPDGARTLAAVGTGGREIATVLLVANEPGVSVLLGRWALPFAALAAALAALAAEALRSAWAGGPAARAAVLRSAAAGIAAGDFRARLPSLPRREFDTRLPWLARELGFANEQSLRVRRLVQSLRTTEPDAERRAALDRALEQARGTDLFREAGDAASPLPGAAQGHRFRGVVAGSLPWIAAAAAWGAWQQGEALPLALIPLVVALGWGVVARRGAHAGFDRGAWVGLLAVGPGLAWPALLFAGVDDLGRAGPPGVALLVWSVLAGLVVATGFAWRTHSGRDDATGMDADAA